MKKRNLNLHRFSALGNIVPLYALAILSIESVGCNGLFDSANSLLNTIVSGVLTLALGVGVLKIAIESLKALWASSNEKKFEVSKSAIGRIIFILACIVALPVLFNKFVGGIKDAVGNNGDTIAVKEMQSDGTLK